MENDDACVVDSGKNEVRLSQIFKWYKADFGGTDEKVSISSVTHENKVIILYIYSPASISARPFLQLLQWVVEHMGDSPKKTSLQGVLSAGKTKISFLPYDWSSNSSH